MSSWLAEEWLFWLYLCMLVVQVCLHGGGKHLQLHYAYSIYFTRPPGSDKHMELRQFQKICDTILPTNLCILVFRNNHQYHTWARLQRCQQKSVFQCCKHWLEWSGYYVQQWWCTCSRSLKNDLSVMLICIDPFLIRSCACASVCAWNVILPIPTPDVKSVSYNLRFPPWEVNSPIVRTKVQKNPGATRSSRACLRD